MPRIRLTKNAIDALPTFKSDVVYWDTKCPGFGVKVTPTGRKVFIVLYRTGGAGSKLRKYTIGPYGRVTLHQARVAAQKVFAAKLEGRDPAAEKRQSKCREVVAGLRWDEVDLAQRVWTIPKARTKNAKAHMVHLSMQALSVLKRTDRKGPIVFTLGTKPFQDFTNAKRRLDQLSGV